MATGMTKAEAHSQGICVKCRKPPLFRTENGIREYSISGMCEVCWDDLFKEEEK
jgi:hypothetical protein